MTERSTLSPALQEELLEQSSSDEEMVFRGDFTETVVTEPGEEGYEEALLASKNRTFYRFSWSVFGAALVGLSFAAFFSWACVLILGRIQGISDLLAFSISYTAVIGGCLLIWWIGEAVWWRHKGMGNRMTNTPKRTQWMARMFGFWVFVYFIIYLWYFYSVVGNTNASNYNFLERVFWRVLVTVMASALPTSIAVYIYAIDAFLVPTGQYLK